MKICVYAICKDEDKYVNQWFRNVMPADYIAVLDTGSTPEFYQGLLAIKDKINAEAGYEKVIIQQKVIKPWRFDVARNESMKLIPADADLCLCTDFDELLTPQWASIIKSKWNGESRVLYQYAWTHTATGLPAKIFTYDKCHKNDGKHFWKYPVHECISIGSIEDDLKEIHTDSCNIADPNPFLEHYPDPEKQRQSSYHDLLEIRAKEFPDEAFSYTYLIAQYFWEQRYEDVIDFGINKALPHLIKTYDADQATMPDTYTYIGDAYRALGQHDKALQFHMRCIASLPIARDWYIGCAWDYLYLNRPDKAIEMIETMFKECTHLHIWSEREFSWTYMPYVILWLAYTCAQRDETAQDFLQLAMVLGAPEQMIDDLRKGIQKS